MSPVNLARKVDFSNFAMYSLEAMLEEALRLSFFYKGADNPAPLLSNTEYSCRGMHFTEHACWADELRAIPCYTKHSSNGIYST